MQEDVNMSAWSYCVMLSSSFRQAWERQLILDIIHSASDMQGLPAVALQPCAEAQEAAAAEDPGRQALSHRGPAPVRGHGGPGGLQKGMRRRPVCLLPGQEGGPSHLSSLIEHSPSSSCSCVDCSEGRVC